MEANGVNYYKGVLLCSRPNQSPSIPKQKPFCGRVVNQDQLGLVPTKQYNQHTTRKRKLPVLNNHKKWLQKFKKQIQQKKNKQIEQENKKKQYLQKIKEQGRQRIKQISNQTYKSNQNKSQVQQKAQIIYKQKQANPHKKKAKPAWAQTQKQAQQNQQNQVDQLLDFFQKGDTQEVKDYLSDQNVKKILLDLKQKIQTLRQQGGQWKNKQINKIQERKKNIQNQRKNNEDKDDVLSRISQQSGAQSVTSQKTAQRVEELQKKKQTKQWDSMTKSSKTSIASVDDQIAKHIADEILRNYPNLKHHSNQSIRKLLEKQAKQQIKS